MQKILDVKVKKKLTKAFGFKGKLSKRKYFEGWYLKMVSKDLKHRLSLIPGISLNKNDTHAFIQIIYNEIGSSHIQTDYIRFNINQFSYSKDTLEVIIDNNRFSPSGLHVDILTKDLSIKGSLDFTNHDLINTNILSPSIMGFFSYIPLMECYHSVVSMNHHISGQLELNNKTFDFSGGKGYIEKDFGKSFPINYIWAQSNNFKDDSTSFMFSMATIPFLGLKFKGLIAILKTDNKEYRFATYNFTQIKKLKLEENIAKIILQKGKLKLFVNIAIDQTKDLASPKKGVMNQTIKEGLSGNIEIALYKQETLLLKEFGKPSGVELMMDL